MAQKSYNHSAASLKASNDFGTANKAAALIRKVFLQHTKEFWDETFYQRLKKAAINIINTGSPSQKGNLQFIDCNINLLKKVEFNSLRATNHFYNFQIDTTLENTDFLKIKIPSFNSNEKITYQYKVTSVVLRLVCGIFHFDLEKGGSTALKDIEFPMDKIFPGAEVKIPLQAAENSVICIALCIYCRNGKQRINRPANKCHGGRIIQVLNIVDGKIKYYERPKDIKTNPPPDQRPEGLDWEINS